MEIKEELLLEKQLKFWEKLCEFHEKNKLTFKLSKPGKRQFFDLRINSKYHIRLSMNSLKKEFQIGFYIENDKFLYNYLLKNKQEIESNFDFYLIWQNFESNKSSVIYTIINFNIDNILEWDNYFYIIFNKSEKIIKVFEEFVSIYYQKEIREQNDIYNSLESKSLKEKKIQEEGGIIKKLLKILFPFFYKKEVNISNSSLGSIESSDKEFGEIVLEVKKEVLKPSVKLDELKEEIKLEEKEANISNSSLGSIESSDKEFGETVLEVKKEKKIEENKKKSKLLIKRKISEDLLVQNIFSEEEMKDFAERLRLSLSSSNIKPIFSPKIVIFLVSVAYYEGISDGGYWNKVFNILKIKQTQNIYLFLIETLKETLHHKNLFIDNGTQWAYNTIMAHTIVPLQGGAFYKYLDFAYSFYDSIDSDVTSICEEELKIMVKKLLIEEKENPFMLKGTKLAIENCLNIVIEYFIEILYYIDILDSQKEDISDLGNVIKDKIKEWYNFNLRKGFYIQKNENSNFLNDEDEDKEEIISITNRIGSLKFTCDKDGVNIETPKMLFDYFIEDAFIKIGEYKCVLNYKKVGNRFIIKSRLLTRKVFDFKLIKLFINGKLIKEWDNKIVFFKENGKNIKPKENKNNIYELDIKKVRILFDSSYSIISTSKGNEDISEANITRNIKYADLNLENEVYYLKKNKELIIIKNILKDEEPEITIENNMIIKNILIEGKPVYNNQPEIFIPYTSPEKYKVFINEELLEVKEGFNKINLDKSGYYNIKICKGIKNTKETRVIRKEKEYFCFKDLNIVFYNEDGDKEYLFSHRDKKPIGNYNFDTKGISKVIYNEEEIEKFGNTYDIFIDNGFNKEFSFQMISENKNYNATGRMRILEWSLDGKNYFPEYNKNILYEDIKDKNLTVRIDNLVGDIIFYGNNKPIGKNKIEFKYYQEELENAIDDIGIKAEFRLSSDKYSPICRESLFKIRFNSKVKDISYNKETKLLDIKVRGKINNMVLQIKNSYDEVIYEKTKLNLDNKFPIDISGIHKVEIFLEEESFDFFAEDSEKTILYDDFIEF